MPAVAGVVILSAMGDGLINQPTGEFLWVEKGDQRTCLVAEVAPLLPISRTYSFSIPAELESRLAVGQRVKIPLGKRGRLVKGYVVSVDRKPWDNTLRPVDSLVDKPNLLNAHLIALGQRIAAHYACPLGKTLHAITPEAVRREAGLSTVRYAALRKPLDEIRTGGGRLSAKRLSLLEALAQSTEPLRVDTLLRGADVKAPVLQGMVKLGWVAITQRKELVESHDDGPAQVEPAFTLNDEQRAALTSIETAIDGGRFQVILLYGVSGSGKTEVYIHAMRRVLALGKQAILLVPEIVLTTQLVGRLTSRFTHVAVLHSGMTDAERSVAYRRIADGSKSVVIGTRSAVFAPCPNLGLICVDEEQEPSYKNMQAPRFHVRDVGILRGQLLNIPVVLGSATPSIETWYRSENRADYRRVTIHHRVRELPLPKVHLVDMRDEFDELKRPVILSRVLENLASQALHRGEQVLILMNRRGFAHRVFCPACRLRIECANCSAGLVVHTSTGETICHYCRSRLPTPTVCPNVTCGAKLEQFGLGTQKVEEALIARYPSARIKRVDSDTMRHRSHYQALVDDFAARKIDVIVGTQMIAKGLDFPFVSLVGVIQADAVSLSTDFRSQERLFQLITQVAGRAGRGDAPGQVVVQTLVPDLPALGHALHHDYESFAANEIGIRQRTGLPPFARLARLVLSHAREDVVRRAAEELCVRIRDVIASHSLARSDVLGPQAAPLSRLRGQYRFDLVLRAPDATGLRQLLDRLAQTKALKVKAAKVIVDVDPVSFA